jgi:hypothetical protein
MKSLVMPCVKKKEGKTCDFELRAVRPDLESGSIHIYAHSEHTHHVKPMGKFYLPKKDNMSNKGTYREVTANFCNFISFLNRVPGLACEEALTYKLDLQTHKKKDTKFEITKNFCLLSKGQKM